MTTVAVIIQDAMYAARVLGQDQTVSSGDGQLVLRRLNRMLDTWSNEKLLIYANDQESFLMTAGQQIYSTSLLPSGRPVAINSMRVTLSNIDYPVDFIDQLKWNGISYKPVQAIPNQCYYDAAFPNANFYFYPIPYAAFTCTLYAQRVLSSPLLMATDLTLPPGYEAAIVAALAVDISPSFGKQPTPAMLLDKTETRAVLKRTNYTPLEMVTPFGNNDSDISNAFLYKGF